MSASRSNGGSVGGDRGASTDLRASAASPSAPRARTTARVAGARSAAARTQTRPSKAPPILVRQVRGGVVESVHRGSIVEVDAAGTVLRVLGDPDLVVNLRSCVKPFGLLALLLAVGFDELDLTPAELAVMASSHSGEDMHVRTIQAVFRRHGLTQTLLGVGTEGAPLDQLTAARLARDGERPGPVRHMCSGQHASMLLLSKLRDWPLEGYWRDEHPSQVAYRAAVAAAFGTRPDRLVTAIDGCGIATFAFPLREVARAYAMLADPTAIADDDPRRTVAGPLLAIQRALLANPEMIGGTRDRIDTSLMKAVPGRLVSKGGMEGLRGIAVLPGPRVGRDGSVGASGIALKIEDGGGFDRSTWAASVETLRQAGVLDEKALRALAHYRRPQSIDPHGRLGAEAITEFELAPVGELL